MLQIMQTNELSLGHEILIETHPSDAPLPTSIFLNLLSHAAQKTFIQDVLFEKMLPEYEPAVAETLTLLGWHPLLCPDDPTDLLQELLAQQPPAWLDSHHDLLEEELTNYLSKPKTANERLVTNLKSLVANARAGLRVSFLKDALDDQSLGEQDELDFYLLWTKIAERRRDEGDHNAYKMLKKNRKSNRKRF